MAGVRKLQDITDCVPPYTPDTEYLTGQFQKMRVLLGCLERGYSEARTTIHPDDNMWQGMGEGKNINNYMFAGRTGLKTIVHALMKAHANIPRTILDFPCGYGRVGRFIRAAFPEAEIYGGDVHDSAIDFCAKEFGMIPFKSQHDLRKVEFQAKFDLIWVGSLMTHLNQDKAILLLDLLTGALADEGILAISSISRVYPMYIQENKYKIIADEIFETMNRGYEYSGFGYSDYPTTTGYGISLISPKWIMNYIAKREDLTLLGICEKDWASQQDMTYIIKRPISRWGDPLRD